MSNFYSRKFTEICMIFQAVLIDASFDTFWKIVRSFPLNFSTGTTCLQTGMLLIQKKSPRKQNAVKALLETE